MLEVDENMHRMSSAPMCERAREYTLLDDVLESEGSSKSLVIVRFNPDQKGVPALNFHHLVSPGREAGEEFLPQEPLRRLLQRRPLAALLGMHPHPAVPGRRDQSIREAEGQRHLRDEARSSRSAHGR